jgi:pSer/pThr/pTyr-binding forkhead associated (FHA) protein/tetratricopeptide (TPR) repeat protein
MYKLHIRDDAGKTKVVSVKRDKVTVGRQEGNTIRLTDRNVSRIHARIVRKDGQIFVEDVSRYGTRVNGVRLKEKKVLGSDDVVAIGDYELKVEAGEKQADTVPATPKAKKSAAKKKSGKKADSKRQEALTTVEKSVGGVDSTSMINLNDIEKAARTKGSKKTRIVADVSTLVAVNTDLAGTEYRLSGAEVVIGRTDDNDVIVDHRSISRNHARIVTEKGRVTIFDLESANGLKINDEFYKQSVLRRGDVIELGHVRMRFVEAGETFVYRPDDWGDNPATPSTQAPVASPAAGSNKLWIVAILLLLAGGGIFAVVWSGGDKPELTETKSTPSDSTAKTTTTGAKSGDSKTTAPNTDTGSSDRAGASTDTGSSDRAGASLQAKLAKKTSLLDAKKWLEAETLCKEILNDEPANQDAKDCVAKAELEISTAQSYDEANFLFNNDKWIAAWETIEAIESQARQSTQWSRFVSMRNGIKPNYVDKMLARGKRALKANKYTEAIRSYDKALKADPRNGKAQLGKSKATKARSEDRGAADNNTRPPKDTTGSDAAAAQKAAAEKARKKEEARKKKAVEAAKKKAADAAAAKETADTGEKMTWRDYYKKAAKAGAGKLAVYEEAASKGFGLAYYYIGRTHMVSGRKGAAIGSFRKFLKKKPGHPKSEQVRDFISQMGGSP